jgi:DNA-directed RNA polymerase alpha subunit
MVDDYPSLTQYEMGTLYGPDGVGGLELSLRALNCLAPPGDGSLRNYRILSIEQLCEHTPRLLRRRRGLGVQCLAEIIVALAGRGRQLKDAEDIGAAVRRRIRKIAEDRHDAQIAEVLPVDEWV